MFIIYGMLMALAGYTPWLMIKLFSDEDNYLEECIKQDKNTAESINNHDFGVELLNQRLWDVTNKNDRNSINETLIRKELDTIINLEDTQ